MNNLKEALDLMKQHAEADRLVQGAWLADGYGEEDKDGFLRGCFFGCAMQTNKDAIEKFSDKYGMPFWLASWAEEVFEDSSSAFAMTWPVKLLQALVDCGEGEPDYDRLVRHYFGSYLEHISKSIKGVDEDLISFYEDMLDEKVFRTEQEVIDLIPVHRTADRFFVDEVHHLIRNAVEGESLSDFWGGSIYGETQGVVMLKALEDYKKELENVNS